MNGPFDRIVSVGMFEHVGVDFYEPISGGARLLVDDGVMLLHSIGRSEVPAPPIPGSRNIFSPAAIFRRCRKLCRRSRARASCPRYRSPAAALRRNAERLAPALPGPARGSGAAL